MAGRDPGVIVRRAQRFDVVLPASVRVGDEHAEVVRFGPRAGDRAGWAEGDLMDNEPLIEVPGRVVRVVMTDRRPAYLIGVGFDSLEEGDVAAVRSIVERFGDSTDPQEVG